MTEQISKYFKTCLCKIFDKHHVRALCHKMHRDWFSILSPICTVSNIYMRVGGRKYSIMKIGGRWPWLNGVWNIGILFNIVCTLRLQYVGDRKYSNDEVWRTLAVITRSIGIWNIGILFNIVCMPRLQYVGGRKYSNDEDSRTLAVITWSVPPHALARLRHNGCNSWCAILPLYHA